ncbi:MAG: radical SAM protein [Nitrospirae bacterium]|nr:radical SAM protein [Nitrospirota bacterium]
MNLLEISGKHESPEYLQISLAAAMMLGLENGAFYRNATPHCINLLLTYDDGCYANCAYCGLGRDRFCTNSNEDNPIIPQISLNPPLLKGEIGGLLEGGQSGRSAKSFIRVEWPRYPLKEIIDRSKFKMDAIERFCVSMVMNKKAVDDTITVVKAIKFEVDADISVLSNPSSMDDIDIQRFKDAGADRFTVAIDCATEEIFNKYRGKGVNGPHRWNRYWKMLDKARQIFGDGMIGCHLIVGLGETEKEMIKAIQKVHDMDGTTHLFSFYQEANSLLENHPQCPAGQFRRIQLARYIIDFDYARVNNMRFDEEGRVVDFGVSEDVLKELIESGIPFQTSGCPGKDKRIACCNRPYGDSRPSDIRSYPFRLKKRDVEKVKEEILS